MKNNSELQKAVQDAISWEPTMHAAEIGVTAKDGVITLSGTVDSFSKKVHAEKAAKNVVGVRAVAEDIIVDYGNSFTRNDTELANDILDAWKNNWQVPAADVKVKVEDGWVKLEGEVAYKFQEEASKNSIENLRGVKGVTNLVKVKTQSQDVLEQKAVEAALHRNWSINAQDIRVDVHRNEVKLSGLVHSLYQKEEAGRLAWNAPGVQYVENELAVIYE